MAMFVWGQIMSYTLYGVVLQPDESDNESINLDLAADDADSLHDSDAGDVKRPSSIVDIEQDNGYDTDLDIDDDGKDVSVPNCDVRIIFKTKARPYVG